MVPKKKIITKDSGEYGGSCDSGEHGDHSESGEYGDFGSTGDASESGLSGDSSVSSEYVDSGESGSNVQIQNPKIPQVLGYFPGTLPEVMGPKLTFPDCSGYD